VNHFTDAAKCRDVSASGSTDVHQDEIRMLQESEIELIEGGATLPDVVKAVIKTADEIVRTVTGGPQA
jgi:hypothetical protein